MFHRPANGGSAFLKAAEKRCPSAVRVPGNCAACRRGRLVQVQRDSRGSSLLVLLRWTLTYELDSLCQAGQADA